jgi:type II secretory pathway component GspD/PulD (secretin)
MSRLTRGALKEKITAVALLSIFLSSASPLYAQMSGSQGTGDVDIKTIAPATPQAVAANGVGGNQNGAAPAAPKQSSASPSLQFTPESNSGKDVEDSTAAKSITIDPAKAPADSDTAKADAGGDGRAVTPAEVTDPQPLAQAPGVTGQPIAGKLIDKRDTRLPTASGSVQIRRPFKLFAREELIRNLSFRETPVKEVIAELARRGGLNILIDGSVKGKITGDLKDVTLNEAMDSVLAAAGLQNRTLDNNTVVVGTMQAMTQLGLNRPIAKAFKLSYAHPFDVAVLLHSSVFNKGVAPEFSTALRRKAVTNDRNNNGNEGESRIESDLQSLGEGGAKKDMRTAERKTNQGAATEEGEFSDENNQTTRLEMNRQVRGTSRAQTQEGVGFNNASTDPGSQQIRQYQETPTDYTVEQNGGGAIVIPDVKNRQIIVVGTPDDIAVAEEAIHFIDRRPKQVHIQASLIEITNSGLRQLGAQLNLQGAGLSGTLLGPGAQPLIQALPGFGSPARPGPLVTDSAQFGPNSFSSNFTTNSAQNNSTNNQTSFSSTSSPPTANTTISNTSTVNPTFTSLLATALAQAFTRTQSYSLNPNNIQTQPIFGGNTVQTPSNTAGFTGLLGALFPLLTTPVAGVQPLTQSQSGFNFLTLSKSAGGRANIATLPAGLGLNLNLLLQTDKAKIVANPSILVGDNTEAMIIIADEVLHKVTSVATITSVTTNVELTKAGVFLDVLPKVTEDGFVVLRLRPQVSAPLSGPQTFGTPPNQTTVTLLSIRDVMNQEVRVKDGQTLVLGGLFREDEAAELAKVPYLAELPVMGALFRNSLKGRHRSELMLLITPKIVEEEPPAVSENSQPKQM